MPFHLSVGPLLDAPRRGIFDAAVNEFSLYGKKWNSQNWQKAPENEWYPYSKPSPDYKYATNPFYDISSQLGGKIIHDKPWFFIAGEYYNSKTPILGVPDKNKENKSIKGFLKLTFQLTPSNRFNVSVNRFKNENTNGGISSYNPEIGYDYVYPGWYSNLNWTSIICPTSFLDVKVGYNYYSGQVTPHGGLNAPGTYDVYLYRYFDNYTDATAMTTKNYQASAHLSHYIQGFLMGSHDLKGGFEFIKYDIIWDRKAPGDLIYRIRNGAPFEYEERLRWYQDTYVNTIVGFIQDRWSITKRLTLNLGVRYNHYRYYFSQESSTRGTVYRSSPFAPRLGITYDLLGDRKNIVKLSYSHYYEGMMRNWFGSYEHRYEGGARYRWNSATNSWYVMVPARPSSDPSPIPVDAKITQSFVWEISGGYERELFQDASLAINFWWSQLGEAIYIYYFDDVHAPYTATNPGPDGKTGTTDDLGSITIYTLVQRGSDRRLTNPEKGNPPWLDQDFEYKSRAIEVRFTKKFSSRWQMMASYLYHRVTGNVDGACAGGIYDPNRAINVYGERGYNLPHQFNLQGNILLPLHIILSAVYRLTSGRYLDATMVIYPPAYRYWPADPCPPFGRREKGGFDRQPRHQA